MHWKHGPGRIFKWRLYDNTYGNVFINFIIPYRLIRWHFLSQKDRKTRQIWVLTYTLLWRIFSFHDKYNILVFLWVSWCCHHIQPCCLQYTMPFFCSSFFKDPENASNQQAQHSKNNIRFTEDKYIVIDLYHQVSDFLNLNNKKWN